MWRERKLENAGQRSRQYATLVNGRVIPQGGIPHSQSVPRSKARGSLRKAPVIVIQS